MNDAALKRILARIDGEKGNATEPLNAPVQELADHDAIDGDVVAVLIDSPIVGPVWFAFADDFKSGDDVPVFFASELPFLRRMGVEELRRRYTQKRIFGGGWVRDRIDEPTKH